jgi:hypothetical protein
MFAFVGLGTQEILLLGALGALIVVPVVIVVMVRASAAPSRQVAELEEENRRLRAELDRGQRPPA